ncbi:MAG: threonylcarbamoyl-AMP synthase [Proteiniphilum sp.]|jgi:L-threonylcarbamoyladenylate synthase|nr:threonylcarbamoyl-AMP synthase [Proteiniphilum sp.]
MRDDIRKACEVLRRGGLILYPTDTVWGIGCDATCEKAVSRIYALKRRDSDKSMLVLMDSPARLQTYVRDVPDIAWSLTEVSDRPLTIIYDGARNLAPNLIAADGSIGIRITSEAFSMALCRCFRKPVVSTSANVSGEPSPASFSQIGPAIREGVDYIVEYGREARVNPRHSEIVKIGADSSVKIIRR